MQQKTILEEKENEIKPISTAWGITNRCRDDYYVLFADFDNIYFHVLIERLNRLIEVHGYCFTNFLILSSSDPIQTEGGVLGSFHVINFGKISFRFLKRLLNYLPVDNQFRDSLESTPYKTNTLRISGKLNYISKEEIKAAPKFICWYPQPEILKPKYISWAHLYAYKRFLGIEPIYSKSKTDKSEWIETKKYDSAKA